jgi:ribonuclease P protein component
MRALSACGKPPEFARGFDVLKPTELAVNGMGPEPERAEDKAALRFPRTARLLQHSAFDRVYKEGRRIFSGNLTVFFRPRPAEEGVAGPRVGFTVSRAMGGAVRRNRIKRRLREAVRLQLSKLRAPVDVVINPKRTTAEAKFTALAGEVERAFQQIGQRLSAKAPGGKAEEHARESSGY